jgi:hypothetical protein
VYFKTYLLHLILVPTCEIQFPVHKVQIVFIFSEPAHGLPVKNLYAYHKICDLLTSVIFISNIIRYTEQIARKVSDHGLYEALSNNRFLSETCGSDYWHPGENM